jgi:hypothetical protein
VAPLFALRSARGDVVMVARPCPYIGYSLRSSAAARRRLGRNRARRTNTGIASAVGRADVGRVAALGGLGGADGAVALAVVDGADHQLGVAEEGDAASEVRNVVHSRTTGGAYRVLGRVVTRTAEAGRRTPNASRVSARSALRLRWN